METILKVRGTAAHCPEPALVKWRLRLWDIEKTSRSVIQNGNARCQDVKTLWDQLAHDIRPSQPSRRRPKHWPVRSPSIERKGASGRKNNGGTWKTWKKERFCGRHPYAWRDDETPPNRFLRETVRVRKTQPGRAARFRTVSSTSRSPDRVAGTAANTRPSGAIPSVLRLI